MYSNTHIYFFQEVLLSDSSDASCDEDDDAPLIEEDIQEMLWLHKQQKLAQQMYHIDKDVSWFCAYNNVPFPIFKINKALCESFHMQNKHSKICTGPHLEIGAKDNLK